MTAPAVLRAVYAFLVFVSGLDLLSHGADPSCCSAGDGVGMVALVAAVVMIGALVLVATNEERRR